MGALLCTAINVISENVRAGPTRMERARRVLKVLVVFSITFFVLNRHMFWSTDIWQTNPLGASVWICISFIWALWMAMWASQCNSHTRTIDRTNAILPLSDPSQRGLEAALVAAKEKALASNPVTTFANRVSEGAEGGSSPCDNIEPLCAVCLVTFDGSTPVRVTSCQHMYCADCLAAFVNQCRRLDLIVCPLCRHPLVDAAVACDTTGASPQSESPASTDPEMPPLSSHEEQNGNNVNSTSEDPPRGVL